MTHTRSPRSGAVLAEGGWMKRNREQEFRVVRQLSPLEDDLAKAWRFPFRAQRKSPLTTRRGCGMIAVDRQVNRGDLQLLRARTILGPNSFQASSRHRLSTRRHTVNGFLPPIHYLLNFAKLLRRGAFLSDWGCCGGTSPPSRVSCAASNTT